MPLRGNREPPFTTVSLFKVGGKQALPKKVRASHFNAELSLTLSVLRGPDQLQAQKTPTDVPRPPLGAPESNDKGKVPSQLHFRLQEAQPLTPWRPAPPDSHAATGRKQKAMMRCRCLSLFYSSCLRFGHSNLPVFTFSCISRGLRA